jgi:hypothetical protein
MTADKKKSDENQNWIEGKIGSLMPIYFSDEQAFLIDSLSQARRT